MCYSFNLLLVFKGSKTLYLEQWFSSYCMHQIAGYNPQGFWFNKIGIGSETSWNWQVPQGCSCCWFKDHTLRSSGCESWENPFCYLKGKSPGLGSSLSSDDSHCVHFLFLFCSIWHFFPPQISLMHLFLCLV